ncbi:CYBC1-like protein [Mya arenaria]|uniref:Essential for reactive oxygen species protein n=1 Tax=Mya arenaria TaxID=6604 RepID=A0ABY7DKQ5_MYAAR|nr:CYBC1-like protein [Mya arenaria]
MLIVVAQVDDVSDVGIREEATSFVGKSYQVVLTLSAGMTVAITDALTFGFPSEHQAIAKKIRTFLDLAEVAGNDYLESSDDEAESTEDSDFECIDKSELVDEICPEEEAGNQEEVGEDIKAADS